MLSGQLSVILSAVLGVFPVFCKPLIGDMSSELLYLGSGIGLLLALIIQRRNNEARWTHQA